MSKKIAGTLLVFNGNKYDYSYKEAVFSLLEFCDIVIVIAGGDDGTYEDVLSISYISPIKMFYKRITQEEWDNQKGKEKLNFFTNKAIEEAERMGYEYQFNLQADEIVHEKSYSAIRQAIEEGNESYMCKRINLWGSCFTQLNVTHDRLPCSSEIVRLAKTNCKSYGDGESVASNEVSMKYLNEIDIWHYGFVRDKKIMKAKVINIQEEVFGVEHDKKLDGSDIFIPERWFDPVTDLKPIDYPHPKIMREWIKTRP